MSSSSFVTLSIIFVLAGLLVPLWPLTAFGIALLALSGHSAFALIAAVILDLLWGVMPGFSQYYFFPVTLLALIGILVRAGGLRYMLEERSSHL